MSYIFDNLKSQMIKLETFKFKSEGNHKISPQVLLSNYPELILNIPELDMNYSSVPFVIREYKTSSGLIDVLYVTNNGDIILIETKLLRNPESHRAVVAQSIDYLKSLIKIDLDTFLDNIKPNIFSAETFEIDDYCRSSIKQNLAFGNVSLVIVGDKIHPNILEMVESIQSAPHLSFTIYLVELSPKCINENTILLNPRCISRTVEIERSVIKLEVISNGSVVEIESSVPIKEGKGSKPILTEEQYFENIQNPEFSQTIKEFIKKWREIEGDIRFGTVGFSAGKIINKKREGIQFVYQNKISLVSEKWKGYIGVEDKVYERYKEFIKAELPNIYDKYIIGNRVEIPFDELNEENFRKVLFAAFKLIE